MIDQATLRSEAYGLQEQVTLLHGDIMTLDLGRKFNLVHSREVFLHVHDKKLLFARLRGLLESGNSAGVGSVQAVDHTVAVLGGVLCVGSGGCPS